MPGRGSNKNRLIGSSVARSTWLVRAWLLVRRAGQRRPARTGRRRAIMDALLLCADQPGTRHPPGRNHSSRGRQPALPGATGGGDGGAGVGAALGVAEGYDTLGGVPEAAGAGVGGHHRVLAEGPAATGRACTGYRVTPALAGVGEQEGTGDDEAGDDEGGDADDQQPAGHGAEGQERDRLDERAHPEDQHPADGGADRRHEQREEQVAAGPAVPLLPLRRLDQQVLVSGHTSPASSMPARLPPGDRGPENSIAASPAAIIRSARRARRGPPPAAP